jgi:hypothetical protein
MTITNALNTNVVQTALDDVFFQEFEYRTALPYQATSSTGELFRQTPWSLAAYIEEVNAPPGFFSKTNETITVPKDDLRVTNTLTTNILKYANSLELSKEFFDDNQHDVWKNNVRQFAEMARLTSDKEAFGFINGFFGTSLTADGSAVISSHSLIKGGTYSNLVTGALSNTTLNTAFNTLQAMKNQAGVTIGCQPAILLVPPALFDLATRITESVLIQGSGNNDLNYFSNKYPFLKVMTNQYLAAGAGAGGSDTAWYLLGRTHGITKIIRQGIQTYLRHWGESDNVSYNYQAHYREAYKVADYVGIVGSLGSPS